MSRTKYILTILLTLCICCTLDAQCIDFTDLTSPNVTCQSGHYNNPFEGTGIAIGRHTVITQQGLDPRTGYQLPFLPPGEDAVVKLGNENCGGEAEAITYNFVVNPDSAILLLKFAVVFEDPSHPSFAQPRFVVRVLNSNGDLVNDCCEYDVTASDNIPGFFTSHFGYFYTNVRWRPWTNVGIDLSDYSGQPIQLQFITYDCDWWAHFGYAYYTASCINNKLLLGGCDGEEVTLLAPLGFESYIWDNGNTTPSATFTVTENTTANCLITSATGCEFTLSATFLTDSVNHISSNSVYDTICEGDSYCVGYFNLPEQWNTGTHVFRNTFFNTNDCSGGDGTITLFLTVLPRYVHIYESICQGTDYDAYGFHYTNLQVGEYTDSTVVIREIGCDSITVLHLSVIPAQSQPGIIIGDDSVCCNEVYTYSLSNAESSLHYNWNVPDGAILLLGQGTSTANIYFTDSAPNPTTISLSGSCGSGNILMNVYHSPSYHIFFQDTLCSGNEYHRYGFDLPRIDSSGWFTFTNQYSTIDGCDSVCVLKILVTNTPTLTTLAQPSEICIGQSVTAHALGNNSGFSENGIGSTIAIGDILCSDSSIVKPSDWPVAGKTPMGVIFHIDSTRLHGWAVHLQEIDNSVIWGGFGIDVPTLINYTNAREAIMDIDGSTNTQIIRNYGNTVTYPAAYSVDYSNGWYLPAIGQLRILYNYIPIINATLQIVNGSSIPASTGPWWFNNWWYLSSTENSNNKVWVLRANGILSLLNKDAYSGNFTYSYSIGSTTYTLYHTATTLIRAVRNF